MSRHGSVPNLLEQQVDRGDAELVPNGSSNYFQKKNGNLDLSQYIVPTNMSESNDNIDAYYFTCFFFLSHSGKSNGTTLPITIES
jgi:hypothetical protein